MLPWPYADDMPNHALATTIAAIRPHHVECPRNMFISVLLLV